MASTAAETKVGSQGLFIRNATGLVRELNAFDAFNLVFSAVLIPVGITQVMGFTPQFWPHANMLVSFAIATPLVACFGLVYLYFTILMPRSGGDYVWVSRTLHPSLGFLVNFSLTFVFLTWVAFNFTFMLSVVGPAASYVAGIHNHYFTSPSKGELMLIATALTAAFAGLMIVGVRSVARYMMVTFALVWIGMIGWLVAMLVGSHGHFVQEWNQQSGTTYNGIINQAHQLGFNAGGGIAWGATLFAMVYCFQVYTGFQWTGYFAGEIKNARRTAVTSIIGGLIASAVIYMVGVGLIYKYFGFKFFGSLVYLGLGGGSDHYHLAFSPYLAALANFLPGPHFFEISVAAALAPWLRRDLHAHGPKWATTKVARIPVITLVAVVSGAAWAFVIYTAFHTGFGGSLGWKPMVKAFTAPVIAIVWYLGVWAYRRTQGIDLTRTFQEIPPE